MRIKKIPLAIGGEGADGGFFICAHETAVACHIGTENRGELAFYTFLLRYLFFYLGGGLNQSTRHSYTHAASCEISAGGESAACSVATAAVTSGA
jgi:hypothetical protein